MTSDEEQVALNKTYGSLPSVTTVAATRRSRPPSRRCCAEVLAHERRAAARRCPRRASSRPSSARPMKDLFADAASGKPVTDGRPSRRSSPRPSSRCSELRPARPWTAADPSTARPRRPRRRRPRGAGRGAPRRTPAAPARRGPGRGAACRTCCCCPAIVLELLVHVVPMVVGVWMSLLRADPVPHPGLVRRAVRRARQLPGHRSTSTAPIGEELLHSFWDHRACTPSLSVGLSWLLGLAGGRVPAATVPRAGRCCAPCSSPRTRCRSTRPSSPGRSCSSATPAWSTTCSSTSSGLVDDRPFWLIGDNSFWALLVVSVWRTWPFAFLCLMAGLQNIPDELYEAARHRRRRLLAAARAGHAADAAAGQPGAGPRAVPVDVQRLQHPVRALRQGRRPTRPTSSPSTSTSSSFITWNFGAGSAMSRRCCCCSCSSSRPATCSSRTARRTPMRETAARALVARAASC